MNFGPATMSPFSGSDQTFTSKCTDTEKTISSHDRKNPKTIFWQNFGGFPFSRKSLFSRNGMDVDNIVCKSVSIQVKILNRSTSNLELIFCSLQLQSKHFDALYETQGSIFKLSVNPSNHWIRTCDFVSSGCIIHLAPREKSLQGKSLQKSFKHWKRS